MLGSTGNGVVVVTATDPNATYLAGRAGVYNYGDPPTYFDELKIDR